MRSFSLLLVLMASLSVWAASSSNGWKTPSKQLADMVDVPATPSSQVSPDGSLLLIRELPGPPTLEQQARPMTKLAGVRFYEDSWTRAGRRITNFTSLWINKLDGSESVPVTGFPQDAAFGNSTWSPNSAFVAVSVLTGTDLQVWVVDAATAKARRLSDRKISQIMIRSLIWSKDSQSVIALGRNQGDAPKKAATLPSGPNIQETGGSKAAVRTYQDMLTSKADGDVFAYYMTGQLLRFGLDGTVTPIGEPRLFDRVVPSPDGRFLLTTSIKRPFSFIVPFYRFTQDIEIWDFDGKPVHTVANKPLAESIPKGFDAVTLGPRSVSWRQDQPATLTWVEAADGGDPRAKADHRDVVYQHAYPFKEAPSVLAKLELRLMRVMWDADGQALIMSRWWANRRERIWSLDTTKADAKPVLMVERSRQDAYSDPGFPASFASGEHGRLLRKTADGHYLFSGNGDSPDGRIPFLAKRKAGSDTIDKVWESQAPYYERVDEVLDGEGRRLITVRQAVDEPPNLYLRDLDKGTSVALTRLPHPMPAFKQVTKETIHYTRADGVKLTGTLYLPPGYTKGDGPLPLLMWAYPREYKSAAEAGQVRTSPYAFVRPRAWGPMPYLLEGYAVLDDPTMPIIGEGDSEPNDTFREQLVNSAQAAADKVVSMGVADPNRLAVGGHSYGAFMVANLLAHSDIFAAGIARSGAYNRTLTPFGFQREERTFWEAGDIYAYMSPFFHAEKIDEPILFIHGEADNNSGTFPLQSRRMFQAVKGLGGTARLVMLPYESHGYSARESLLHMLWEQGSWLDKHVKNKKEEKVKDPS